MALKERIATIPRDDGWWHLSNGETYLRLAEELVEHGLSEDEVVDILESAYFAAVNEYGA